MRMSWYEKWVISFLSAGLAIVSVNVKDPAFLKTYKKVLKALVKTADVVRPYVEEE